MSDTQETVQIAADGSVTVLLSTPIEAYGDRTDRLKLRRPTGKEIRACGGSPIKITAGGEVNGAAIFKYAELLAGVPGSAIDQLDPADYLPLEAAILSFFIPRDAAPTSSTATTTSPGDGVSTLNPSSRSPLMDSSSLSSRRSA